MSAAYEYADGELLERPHDYFYSPFGGAGFLQSWRAQRETAAQWFEATGSPSTPPRPADGACALFDETAAGLERDQAAEEARYAFAKLVQRFEVSKRVYGAYDAAWRPVDRDDFRELSRYVVFGELLERAHRSSGELPSLNALLKLNDILGARRESVPIAWRPAAARLLRAELRHVHALALRVGAA